MLLCPRMLQQLLKEFLSRIMHQWMQMQIFLNAMKHNWTFLWNGIMLEMALYFLGRSVWVDAIFIASFLSFLVLGAASLRSGWVHYALREAHEVWPLGKRVMGAYGVLFLTWEFWRESGAGRLPRNWQSCLIYRFTSMLIFEESLMLILAFSFFQVNWFPNKAMVWIPIS